MGFFSFFKKNRRTHSASYTHYKTQRFSKRKPFKPKIQSIDRNPQDRKTQRRREKWSGTTRVLKILLIFIGLGALTYLALFTNAFQIQAIEIVAETDTSEEQMAIQNYFQAYLGENLLLFNPSEHEKKLLEEYFYLKTLDIDRNFFHSIKVTLETYPPIANVRIDQENGGQSFFVINEKGYTTGLGVSLEDLPTIVMDVTGTDASLPSETRIPQGLNEELIAETTLKILLETTEDFEAKFNMQILEIHYLKRARELHLYTERNFFVWLDLTQEVSLQLAKLKKALTELNIYEAPLDYIDLRISGQNGEKVIYKLSPGTAD